MSLIKWQNNGGRFPSFPSLTGIVDNFFRDDDRFFNSSDFPGNRSLTVPAVNINESKNSFDLEVAAPGMNKEDFKIEVSKGMLTISAEKKSEKEDKEEGYSRKEFNYQSFSRSFWLPENAIEEAVKASYADGILKIEIPKTAIEEKEDKKLIEVA